MHILDYTNPIQGTKLVEATMVALICTIGICIYFYFWTKRVKKEQDQEWATFGEIEEAESIQGIVSTSFKDKKRLYHQYFYLELQLSIYDATDQQPIKVLWQKPSRPDTIVPDLQQKDSVICYGKRKGQLFYANRIEKL